MTPNLAQERTDTRKGHSTAWYRANKERAVALAAAWRAKNLEKTKAASKKWREANRVKKAAAARAWKKANPDKVNALCRKYRQENQSILSAIGRRSRAKHPGGTMRARAAKIGATPAWADGNKIRAFYSEARRLSKDLKTPHHVDHIVPLRSRVVCGLHVEHNLRVLLATVNCSKGNRTWPDMPQ